MIAGETVRVPHGHGWTRPGLLPAGEYEIKSFPPEALKKGMFAIQCPDLDKGLRFARFEDGAQWRLRSSAKCRPTLGADSGSEVGHPQRSIQ